MIGITTAIVSMNAVVSHCAATAVMPRSPMRCGIATPIVVSLRIATNAAPEQQPDDAAVCTAQTRRRPDADAAYGDGCLWWP